MLRTSMALALTCALIGPAASALAQTRPTIAATAIPPAYKQLNIEEVLANNEIILTFTAQVAITDTYEYELSYDQGASVQTPTVARVRLDESLALNVPHGTVISGRPQQFTIHPDEILCDTDPCAETSKYPGKSGASDNFTRNIVLRVFRAAQPLEPATSESYTWAFQLDTKPPPPPKIKALLSGEKHLEVQWSAPVPDTDVTTYEVLFCPQVPGAATGTIAEIPCSSPSVSTGIPKNQSSFLVEGGLVNEVPAAVAVRSRDAYDNLGLPSSVRVEVPHEVADFFELYKMNGGSEEGGFCFVATAAYGSYGHPMVRALRAFRDHVLKQTPAGTALVWSYYHVSPPFAAALARDPEARAWARLGLLPVTLAATLVMLLPLGGLATVLWRFGRRRASVALGLLVLLAPLAARADSPRPESKLKSFGLGFEFRAGPYLPQLGQESGGDPAFRQVYSPNPRVLFALGSEVQLYRGFGTLALGASFGFMQWVGKGYFVRGAELERSNDTTVFNLLPLSLTAGYRFDWLADETGIPFVPYARGGLAYHLWWVTDGVGDISRWEGSSLQDPGDDQKARGGKLGLTGSLGVALMLNTIEPQSARNLFESTSIRGTYVFAEVNLQQVDGFGGKGFDLSDSTWNVGLFFEL